MPNTILILDDFRISNEIISDMLEENGYITYTCQKSKEALDLLKRKKNRCHHL